MRTVTLKLLFALLFLSILQSCQKDSPPPADEVVLIFGEYFGFCAGECSYIYKYEKEELFADQIENFYSEELLFSTKAMDRKYADEARILIDNFPLDLFDEKSTIGSPDSHDQGGYYFKHIQGDRIGEWRIDTDQGSIPKYLHSYIADLTDVLKLLKK